MAGCSPRLINWRLHYLAQRVGRPAVKMTVYCGPYAGPGISAVYMLTAHTSVGILFTISLLKQVISSLTSELLFHTSSEAWLGALYKVLGMWYQAGGTRNVVPGMWYQVSSLLQDFPYIYLFFRH